MPADLGEPERIALREIGETFVLPNEIPISASRLLYVNHV